MISTPATKVTLSADDLAEYDSAKLGWKKASVKQPPRNDELKGTSQPQREERAEAIRSRIGLTSNVK